MREDEELIRTKRKKNRRVKKKRAPDTGVGGGEQTLAASRVKLELGPDDPKVNGYYIAAADRYRRARYVSFVLLIAFLIVMLLFFRENITYSNMVYLLKDLDADSAVTAGSFADFSYDRQYSVSFGMFRGRVAMAGNSSFSLYNSTGSRDLSVDEAMGTPRMATGDKYALAYDAGGTNYALYTSVARIKSGESDEIIEDGAVADDGTYALLTRSDSSKYLVTVYDSDFRTIVRYYKDKYVTDIALSPDGGTLAVASAQVAASEVSGELSFTKVGSEEAQSISVSGSMPIGVRYTDDGTLVLMCDNALILYRGGEQIARIDFDGKIPGYYDVSTNRIAVCFSLNALGSENDLTLFDTEGNILYNIGISEKVDMIAGDGAYYLYALCEDRVIRYDTAADESVEEQVRGTVLDMLPTGGGPLLVCTGDSAYSLFGAG